MYYHVIQNAQRDGKQVYIHVKVYKRFSMLKRWLDRTGQPCWIITSHHEYMMVTPTLGGNPESYWNTGGFGFTTMPVFPFWPWK